MGPREATITISREGDDKGGVFVIRKMAAIPATDWFIRAVQLLARSGADVPPHIMAGGPEAFVALGLGTVLQGVSRGAWGEIKPLLEELLACVVSYQPPGGQVALTAQSVIQGQILEPATVFQLYEEVLSLHLGFSLLARLSDFGGAMARMIASIGQNTETSMPEPPPSSPNA
jgi:hypothetical protein